MQSLLFAAFAAFVFSNVSHASESLVQGTIDYLGADGKYRTEAATLAVPENFQGNLSIQSRAGTLTSSAHEFSRAGNTVILNIAFRDLPEDVNHTVLILSGTYVPGKYFKGQCLTKTHANQAELEKSFENFKSGAAGYEVTGSFQFGKSLPERSRRSRATGNPLNPCPDNTPCYTTAGVGRHPEYYSGKPIQNPGGPRPAATFERGVPYAWTRQGQIEAQRVGIQRDLAYQRSLYRNRGWYFGFFFRF